MTLPASKASELYELIDNRARLHLHAGQTRIWDSTARFVFGIAGTQGGKTCFGPWWMHREIGLCGGGDYLAVTSSYDLFKLKMLPEMRKVFEHILKIGRYWSGDKVIELRNPETGEFQAGRGSDQMWGRIILRSAASEGGLESATAKAAWLDEVGQDEFGIGAWEAVLRRLSLHQGRVLGTTTPYNLGWMKQLIFDRWQKGDPDIEVVQFASIINPAFPQAEFDARRKTMPDWKFRMFYMGQFERPAGLIYGDFIPKYRDEGGHLVEPFQIPPHWPRYGGIDPGAVHTAKVWLAHDPREDVYYLYREGLTGWLSTPEHVAEINQFVEAENERVITWHIGQKSESQQRMDYAQAGLRGVVDPEVSDVESGIDRVIQLFKEFRLFIFDTMTRTRDELGTYSREVDEMGEPLEKIRNKQNFHMLDGVRYVVAGVTLTHSPAMQSAQGTGIFSSQQHVKRPKKLYPSSARSKARPES